MREEKEIDYLKISGNLSGQESDKHVLYSDGDVPSVVISRCFRKYGTIVRFLDLSDIKVK